MRFGALCKDSGYTHPLCTLHCYVAWCPSRAFTAKGFTYIREAAEGIEGSTGTHTSDSLPAPFRAGPASLFAPGGILVFEQNFPSCRPIISGILELHLRYVR